MIVLFSNRLNHHQAPLADALFRLTNGQFRFVETSEPNEQSNKGSRLDFSSRPYLVKAWYNHHNREITMRLSVDSDIALFGANSLSYEIIRSRESNGLSFEVSERWLKKGLLNAFSPRFIKSQWYYHTLFKKKPVYKLCAGAFCASDHYLFHSFIDRCYKWGYFIEGANDSHLLLNEGNDESIRIMWCARFLALKHPELPVLVAKRFKEQRINFILDMFGTGPEFSRINKMILDYGLTDCVFLKGAQDNTTIIDEMKRHDVFLFTSDRKEGWGAVVNEAMSCGCAVVSSDKVGCAPFLINHHQTGCLFKDQDVMSLHKEVLWLIESKDRLRSIRQNSLQWYYSYWTPDHAAASLLQLIDDLNKKGESSIELGPCSKALPY